MRVRGLCGSSVPPVPVSSTSYFTSTIPARPSWNQQSPSGAYLCVMTCAGHPRPHGRTSLERPWSLQCLRYAAGPMRPQTSFHPYRLSVLSCFRRLSPAYEQKMGDEDASPLIRQRTTSRNQPLTP